MSDTLAQRENSRVRARAAALLATRRQHPRRWRAIGVALVLGLLLLAWSIVYLSGGTRFAYVHVSYVPIIAAAALFGLPGGLIGGILAGIVMGPLMPLHVVSDTAQSATNWLTRMGFFAMIGGLAGLAMLRQSRQLQLIRQHGYRDSLTNLPNRVRCLSVLERVMADRTDRKPAVLLSLGIARFDAITSSFGHKASDELQRQAAERIQHLLPDEAKIFHISNGVFALILTAAYDEAAGLAEVLVEALDEPFLIERVQIWTGGHAGLAQQGTEAGDALALLRASSSALREAEVSERGVVIYDAAKDLERRAMLRLLPDLQRALRTPDEIVLHYQPKVDLKTGACIGAEALVRWHHAERGMVPPGQFIPLAEQTALIEPLTTMVLRVAVKQLAHWQQTGLELSLAVNVSVRNLEDPKLPALIDRLLLQNGVDAAHLELEVTESGLMTSPDAVRASLLELRKLGISIALDDFGTGQSSLSYLKDLPADTLKLDRSFIRDLATNQKSRMIVDATIETAHKLGFRVVAEGIEDQDVYDLLCGLSCDQAQGFFISRPLPEPQFVGWVLSRSRSRTVG